MRKRFIKVLGVVIIASGIALITYTLYTHYKYSNKMNDLLENSVIYEADVTRPSEKPNSTSSTQDFAIEVMNEDQKVKKITNGTPVIRIPSLNIKVPVVDGTSSESLRLGAGKFDNSVNMGEKGNFCVAGHSSTIYNCIFNDLEKIKLLDVIECYNSKGVCFKYYVINTFKTNPENYGVTLSSNEKMMTIVTCTDNGTRRFIVSAMLMTDDELYDYKMNLKQNLVKQASSILEDSSKVDLLSYIKSKQHISKIPYRVKYVGVEDAKPFFTNYVLSEDKLKVNEHNLDIVFNQAIGFDFNKALTEVSKNDL